MSWDSLSSTEVRIRGEVKNGDCFLIRDNVAGGAGSGTTYAKHVSAATCAASDAATYKDSSVAAGW